MPDLLKVGFSSKDPELRARELDNTGIPFPYVVEYDFLVSSPRDIEQQVHMRLNHKREGKEWFRCSLPEAVEAIRSVVDTDGLLENLGSRLMQEVECWDGEEDGMDCDAYSVNERSKFNEDSMF
jgi:5-formaminoimidazole-4-carboxamide-1-beta-D-ribofuranosyl 5'-monophosphate synthetase